MQRENDVELFSVKPDGTLSNHHVWNFNYWSPSGWCKFK